MSKITTELEYFNALIEILEQIYDCSNESNEKITGIKNKEQPYELKIKDILDEYSIESNKSNKSQNEIKSEIKCKYTNLFYEYQPNGSQQPPDYMVYCENYEKIKIECKSSKTNKPVWNCSIPEKNTIYVFLDTKNKKTYIFDGEDIIGTQDRLEIIKFNDELKTDSKTLLHELSRKNFTIAHFSKLQLPYPISPHHLRGLGRSFH